MLGISLVVGSLSKIVIDYVNNFNKNNLNSGKECIILVKDFKAIYQEFKVDKLVIKLGYLNEYLHNDSGFDSEKSEYIVYINLNKKNIKLSSIMHELKHAYVDWCIFKNGGVAIKDSLEVKELYTNGFEDLLTVDKHKIPLLQPIIRCFYYTTKLEIPAFLENQLCDSNFYYKKRINNMLNMNMDDFKNKACEKEFEIIRSYNIPRFNRFKNYLDFLDYCDGFFKKRGGYIKKKLNKVDYFLKVADNDWLAHLLINHTNGTKILSNLEWKLIFNLSNTVISNRGQWDFPGECTLIISKTKRITMVNVNHDVLGIDSTGKFILMKPGLKYQFNSEFIFEIPYMGKWKGLVKKIVNKC